LYFEYLAGLDDTQIFLGEHSHGVGCCGGRVNFNEINVGAFENTDRAARFGCIGDG
jgi:hypothetical protein